MKPSVFNIILALVVFFFSILKLTIRLKDLIFEYMKKINNIDIDNEALAKKLIEYKVPKREIAKIISSITQEKVNKVYDLIKNL